MLKLDTTDLGVPTVRSMVLAMDGVTLDDGTVLDTVVAAARTTRATRRTSPRSCASAALGLLEELFHTVASPPMAFLFFVIGVCLLIFEFFTAGVGVAGLVGAVLAVLGCYGLAALPARTGALRAAGVVACSRSRSTCRWASPGSGPAWAPPCSSSPPGSCTSRSPATTCALSWVTLFVAHRRGAAHVHRRHAVDGAHPIRHAHHRPRVDDRQHGCRRGAHQPRRRGPGRRGEVAGAHQPGHADRGRRRAARGRHRRCHARGRTGRGRGPRLPRAPRQDAEAADERSIRQRTTPNRADGTS